MTTLETDPDALTPHDRVPMGLRVAAAWSWRILIVGLLLACALVVLIRLQVVSVSLFVALLVTALLTPLRQALLRLKFPRGLATATTLVLALGILGGALTFVGARIAGDWSDLRSQVNAGLDDAQAWLMQGPLHVSQGQIDQWITQARMAITGHQDALTTGALSTASTAGEVLTGCAIAFFTTIFLLHDGDRIWRWFVDLFPGRGHERLEVAGQGAWRTLTGYIRGTVVIALTDAVLIGVAIALLGVPLALPLGVLVFIGAFVPIIGALVAGFVAVAVALATKGFTVALLVLAAIIIVQQLEGHVLQPIVMNKAVAIHPLAVVLAVAAGSILAGIVGAVIAVPIVAVLNVVVKTYSGRTKAPLEEIAEDKDVDPHHLDAGGEVKETTETS